LLHRDKTLGQALLNGGKLTLVIVGFILIFAIFAWDWAFTTFHKLFFTGDSWLFYIDDTLIRLYPVEFWITCTMMIGVVVIVMSLLMITMGKWILKRQKHA
jgi:integral membrane protein (TIGR01906 family)